MKIFIFQLPHIKILSTQQFVVPMKMHKYKDFITFGVCDQSSNGIDLDSIKFKIN